MATSNERPSGRHRSISLRLRGVAAALLTVAGAACGADVPAPTTPGAMSAPPSSDTPDASATSAPDPSDGGTVVGEEVLVVADELRVRAEPSTDAELVATVPWGTSGVARSGPVDGDGYTWYEIEADGRTGWAASGDAEDRWLVPVGPAPGGEALLAFSEGCDVVGPLTVPTTTILADGTVVTGREALQVGRLNDEGLAVIRDEVLDLPVLQQAGSYEPEPLPGAEPPGHGACRYSFLVGDGAEAFTVESVSWFGDQEEAEFYVPSPERRLLSGVAQDLGEIGSLLDERLWRELPRTYVATEFLLALLFPGLAGGDAIPYERLGLPGPDEVDATPDGTRCTVITLAQAVDAMREIRASGNPVGINAIAIAPADDGGQGWSVLIAPRTPAGAPACDDVNG